MSSSKSLKEQQITWARSRNIPVDENGYVPSVELNLFKSPEPTTTEAFLAASGSELVDGRNRPAKMKALHSSSALAVNFFDYWVSRDKEPLARALGLDSGIVEVAFERKFPTELKGTPPNLDVVLVMDGGHVIAIESKFREWLTPKRASKKPFSQSYFPAGRELWGEKGLDRCQLLAEKIQSGEAGFKYLDAAQLLKHSLGLAYHLRGRFSLYYLYSDWAGNERDRHAAEIGVFSETVGSEIRFLGDSYQRIVESLSRDTRVDSAYTEYLSLRYPSEVE